MSGRITEIHVLCVHGFVFESTRSSAAPDRDSRSLAARGAESGDAGESSEWRDLDPARTSHLSRLRGALMQALRLYTRAAASLAAGLISLSPAPRVCVYSTVYPLFMTVRPYKVYRLRVLCASLYLRSSRLSVRHKPGRFHGAFFVLW